jgi:phosphatidylinositol glycan class M
MVSALNLLIIGLIVRVFSLFVMQYCERINNIPLTDVDYFVFSDAAAFVKQGLSPYLRHTYRYTPYLAWLLSPFNSNPIFGKIIFILFDWLTAIAIYKINGKISSSIYLFNPLTIGIAARGNAESIIAFLCVLSLGTINYWWLSGPILAFAVHFKTFPAPWAITIWLHLASKKRNWKIQENWKIQRIPCSFEGICYGCTSLITFALLTAHSYNLYGDQFINHAHLHHLTRQDTRHNFSIWFLPFYLCDGESSFGSFCFFSQLILFFTISLKYFDQIYFASFLHAFIFVTFNKVITSQYFIWYISLLPLIWNNLKDLNKINLLLITVLWFVGQGIWLIPAYYLEMKGENTFIFIHFCSLIHFALNIISISFIIKNFKPKLKQN